MDRIKNLVGGDSAKIQAVMRLYAMERFLDRLANSQWKNHFVVKGGTLVTALVGVSMRTTMDIDMTATGITLQEDEIERAVKEICMIETGDGMTFHIKSIDRIMDEHKYPGIRLSLEALFNRTKILKVAVEATPSKRITVLSLENARLVLNEVTIDAHMRVCNPLFRAGNVGFPADDKTMKYMVGSN